MDKSGQDKCQNYVVEIPHLTWHRVLACLSVEPHVTHVALVFAQGLKLELQLPALWHPYPNHTLEFTNLKAMC
jgi:hypothetical protein